MILIFYFILFLTYYIQQNTVYVTSGTTTEVPFIVLHLLWNFFPVSFNTDHKPYSKHGPIHKQILHAQALEWL